MDEIIKNYALRRKIEFEAGTTNDDILSDQERMLAKDILCDIEGDSYPLNQEIVPLTAERVEMASIISKLRTALAPHKRLPNEALAEIFVYTTDEQHVRFPPEISRCPWVLRQVCSRWRAVASNEPRLWNQFTLDANKIDTIQLPKLISLANDVLPLAGLLEVSLDEPWHVAICPELLELIDMLVIPRLARLKVLSVQTSILSFARLLGSPSQSLAHLESLSLDLCGVIHVREVTEQFANADILRRATQLRVLEISPRVLVDARITNVVMSLPIPWHQLTSLVIGELLDHAAWDLHRVLRGCHSLKRLRAKLPSVLSVEKRPLAANYVHNLPNLQHVELEGASMLSPALLMSLLPWNQLTSLKLSRLKLLPWNSSNDFTKGTAGIYIVLRECLQIEELSIHTVHEPPPEVATTFMLPRLKDLTVIKQSVPFLDQLIAPALVCLKLMGQTKNAFPARKLCDLIKRSECALATFTSLGISHCGSPPTILQFLALVPSLDALHCRNLVLDPRCIHSLTSGEVLPQLRFLSCRLQEASLLPFVDGLEARAKAHRAKGMNPVMLRAIGYIGREETFPSELMENIALRMEQIKVEYGPGLSVRIDK